MKTLIIGLDHDCGSAKIGKKSREYIRELTQVNSLLAADFLKDIVVEFGDLYAEAVDEFYDELFEIVLRAKAQKMIEQEARKDKKGLH